MKIIYPILLFAILLSCDQASTSNTESKEQTTAKKLDGKFVHMVFFWLNEDVDVSSFISSTEQFLSKVEVVKSFHLGTPAMTPREVVDNSYTVCLLVTFDSTEDQDIYQEHEAHLRYVAEMSDRWHTVKIFDSLKF